MSELDDKRELLKLKQGLVSEEESEILSGERPNSYERPQGRKAKAENFFYHNKPYLIAAAFLIIVFGFIAFDALFREKGDIKIITVSSNEDSSTALYNKLKDIEDGFELYTPNFDGNKYVRVENYFMNINQEGGLHPDVYSGNVAKLFGEVQAGEIMLFMGDKAAFEEITGEGDESFQWFFLNLEERYPDNEFVEGFFYKVKGSPFAYDINMLASCPEDMYIGIRNKEGEAFDKAIIVLDNLVNGVTVNS